MSVITIDYGNNDNSIDCFKNENRYNITLNIINKIKKIDKNQKILYFNYSNNNDLINKEIESIKNNITIINKQIFDINEIKKYIILNNPNYICIDYLKMVDDGDSYMIENIKIKYILDKFNELTNNYNTIFIITINEESK